MDMIVLKAKEGYVYTDGKISGKKIYLPPNENIENFREFSIEEYEKIEKDAEENLRKGV